MNNIQTGRFTRISKRTAEKLYNQGQIIYIVACNMAPNGIWQPAFPIGKDDAACDAAERENPETFAKRINAFEYYNCDNERGRYTAFYIKQ